MARGEGKIGTYVVEKFFQNKFRIQTDTHERVPQGKYNFRNTFQIGGKK